MISGITDAVAASHVPPTEHFPPIGVVAEELPQFLHQTKTIQQIQCNKWINDGEVQARPGMIALMLGITH